MIDGSTSHTERRKPWKARPSTSRNTQKPSRRRLRPAPLHCFNGGRRATVKQAVSGLACGGRLTRTRHGDYMRHGDASGRGRAVRRGDGAMRDDRRESPRALGGVGVGRPWMSFPIATNRRPSPGGGGHPLGRHARQPIALGAGIQYHRNGMVVVELLSITRRRALRANPGRVLLVLPWSSSGRPRGPNPARSAPRIIADARHWFDDEHE